MKTKPIILQLTLLVLIAFFLSGCTILDGANKKTASEPPESRVWKTDDLRPDHLALAEKLVQDGFYDVALVQLKQARVEPGNARIYDLSGVCTRETEDTKGALSWFRKALAENSEDASVHNNLGLLYAMTGKPENAAVSFERAVELDPGRADFCNNLGWANMELKRYTNAEGWFKKALAVQPGNETAVNNLALCLGMQEQYDNTFELLMTYQTRADARHNLTVIRSMADGTAGPAGKSPSAFDIQNQNNQTPVLENSAEGLPGKTAQIIYSDKYQKALKKN